MNTFSQYAKMYKRNITGAGFLPELKAFLRIPNFSYFNQDLKFSEDGTKLEASRVLGFMKSDGSSTFQKNAMLTLRDDIAEKSKLDAFPIVRLFIFFEQFAITSRETIRNLIIAGLAVLVVTSPFLVDCTVTFLVVLNFSALICELFGLMVIWDVSLNSVSMIILVMAIGFAVDYSAHIAHAYVISNKVTANERVVDALSTLGASVAMGANGAQGCSTFDRCRCTHPQDTTTAHCLHLPLLHLRPRLLLHPSVRSWLKHPEITSAALRQDNAGCYHSAAMLSACRLMGEATGIDVKRVDFSDPQGERRVPAERAMIEHLDEEEDEDGDEEEEGASSGLLSCPVDGCICTYQKYYNLERHLLFGKCKLVSEKHTLFDQAVLAYAKKI
ncbi:hypothetical protein ACROYT_G021018 [Oculina patagonica]